MDSGNRIGVEIMLGKTDLTSVEVLGQRYATIASAPQGQVAAIERAVVDMARDAAIRGAALAVLPVAGWALVGRTRRRELGRALVSRRGAVVAVALMVVVATVTLPWEWREDDGRPPAQWQTLQEFVGDEVTIPDEADGVQVLATGVTASTKRLVASIVSSYERGQAFYAQATTDAADLELREPAEDETVVVVVSDRHDNVGMDEVARAIGDAGGATAVYDAGDDTSTGETWEAFSLDSVNASFDDLDRWAVAGNHDNGTFVRDYLADLGWTYFDGEPVEGPGGSTLLGVDDPRASGLGDWRDETGLSFAEVEERLTEVACDADADGERIATLLVHDANMGSSALDAGCVDLVIGGHTHVESGPTEVVGENGETGYSYTVGTTGGAAYAIALGSKLRRAAGVSLITYRDGRPVGVQGVTLQTNGRYDVGAWVELTYGEDGAEDERDHDGGGDGGDGGDADGDPNVGGRR
ncbi:metallophosphoesterase family protein [Nocardioides sp. BGMRC 2183]|nr:metallophosphoesterase family protein [Nocardioides sp. BGMRC 2183]